MPIQFKCSCGKALMAKDDQAGKRTKCPACQKVLAIPQPAAAPPPKPESIELATEEEEPRCPHCAAFMAPAATVCAKCGFNRQTGTLPAPEKPKAAPRVAISVKAVATVALIGGALAAGWFFVGAPLLAKTKLSDAYAHVLGGDLPQALKAFERLRPKVGPKEQEKLDLWTQQVRLEMEKNAGETLTGGQEVTSSAADMTVAQQGSGGGARLFKVTLRNNGSAPLRLSLDHFYIRGVREIKPVDADHADNTVEGLIVPPGHAENGVLAFRSMPPSPVRRDVGGGTLDYYYLSFNDGVRYVKRMLPF